MELGLSEILIIAVVVIILISITRFSVRRPAEKTVSTRLLTATEARDAAIIAGRRSKGKIIGIVMTIIGILLITTAPSLIKAFFMSYLGGAFIIIIGLSFFFLSRRS